MLWLASAGIGGNSQPGALIALFVFCALAAFEALAPVTGAFQHLGQVIASARRISQITDQQPEVTFVEGEASVPAQVALTFTQVTLPLPAPTLPALENISLQIAAGEHRHSWPDRLRKVDAVATPHPGPGSNAGRDFAQRPAAVPAQRSHPASGDERGAAARAPVQPLRCATTCCWRRQTLTIPRSARPSRKWGWKNCWKMAD